MRLSERPLAAPKTRYQPGAARAEKPAETKLWPAVVYLAGSFPVPANVARVARVDQRELQFVPCVLPVLVGTRVEFPNLDDEYHNVLSYSKAKEFDLGRYRKDEKPPAVIFEKPGVVDLDCEIHGHMRATILVLETPHFQVTDREGRFRFTRLPAGKFTLMVWLDPKTTLAQEVELRDGQATTVHFPPR